MFSNGKNKNDIYIDNINMRISLLSKQKEIIDEVEKIYKDEEITNDLKEKIQDWYEIHKDRNKCVFCGNTNIESAKTKWKKVFLNEYSNNITELADILGHNSLETTRLYTRSSNAQKKNKLEKMSFK